MRVNKTYNINNQIKEFRFFSHDNAKGLFEDSILNNIIQSEKIYLTNIAAVVQKIKTVLRNFNNDYFYFKHSDQDISIEVRYINDELDFFRCVSKECVFEYSLEQGLKVENHSEKSRAAVPQIKKYLDIMFEEVAKLKKVTSLQMNKSIACLYRTCQLFFGNIPNLSDALTVEKIRLMISILQNCGLDFYSIIFAEFDDFDRTPDIIQKMILFSQNQSELEHELILNSLPLASCHTISNLSSALQEQMKSMSDEEQIEFLKDLYSLLRDSTSHLSMDNIDENLRQVLNYRR